MFLFLIFPSCDKDNPMKLEPFSSRNQVQDPVVINGTVCFNDTSSFTAYYDYISEYIEVNERNLEEYDTDSLLTILENNLSGYNSLRSYFSSLTEEINDFQDYLDVVYIFDDVLASILNENSEIRIGDNTFICFGDGGIYQVPTYLDTAISYLRTKSKHNTLVYNELLSLPAVELHKANILYNKMDAMEENFIYPTSYVDKIECEFNKVHISGFLNTQGLAVFSNLDDYIIDWTVNYGDGTPNKIFTTASFSEFYTYSSAGSFEIELIVRFRDYNNYSSILTDTRIYNVNTESACSLTDLIISGWTYIDSNPPSYAMSAVFEFEGQNWFGLYSAFRAKTRCWKWNASKAKWEKSSHKAYVKMFYTFRNDICNIMEDSWDTKDYKKTHERSVIERYWFGTTSIYNDNNKSIHKAIFPTETLTLELFLQPCP